MFLQLNHRRAGSKARFAPHFILKVWHIGGAQEVPGTGMAQAPRRGPQVVQQSSGFNS